VCRDGTGLAQHRERAVKQTTATTVDVDQLVADSLPLVRAVVGSMAHHYPRHCDRDELVAAGTFGLVEAARASTRARASRSTAGRLLRIRGPVVDAVRALDFAPRALRSSARDLTAVRETLERELGRTPTSEQVAERWACRWPTSCSSRAACTAAPS
jgi:RNA polymerase sigma factor for flagellar operon FliA